METLHKKPNVILVATGQPQVFPLFLSHMPSWPWENQLATQKRVLLGVAWALLMLARLKTMAAFFI